MVRRPVQRGRLAAVGIVFALLSTACSPTGDTSPTSRSPTTTEGGAHPTGPASIVIRRFGERSELTSGQPVPVGVVAHSEVPLVRVELWSQAGLVGSADLEPVADLAHLFSWTPAIPGLDGLVARVVDANGNASMSLPSWARIVDRSDRPDQARGTRELENSGAPRHVTARSQGGLPLLLLATDPGSCVTTAQAPAGTDLVLMAASFGPDGFSPIGATQGGVLQFGVGGSMFAVYGALGDGQVFTAPTIVNPPPGCATSGWEGDLALINGVLDNPGGVDLAYLYASLDGENWLRVPNEDQTFVEPGPGGGFDFGPMLPVIPPGGDLWFEAWGWSDGVLGPLGSGHYSPPQPPGNTVTIPSTFGPVLPAASLDWVVDPAKGTLIRLGTICTFAPTQPTGGGIATLPDYCTNTALGQQVIIPDTFRWGPLPGGTTHGVLQVSHLPPPAGPSLAYPGLIHSQPVLMPSGGTIDFAVDLANLLGPSTAMVGAVVDPNGLNIQLISTLDPSSPAPAGYSFLPPELVASMKPNILYLRVVPMVGVQPLPGVSNLVKIDLLHEKIVPIITFDLPAVTLAVEMTPPHLPNSAFRNCVRVVENPFGSKNPSPASTPEWYQEHPTVLQTSLPEVWYQSFEQQAFVYENGVKVNKGMVPGATVCAWQLSPPEKSVWDTIVDAVNFVVWVWDMYSFVYGMIKDKVAEALVFLTQCEEVASKDTCGAIASAVVNTAFIAVGAPPTIPKFSEMVEAAKEDIAAFAVEAAVQAGILDCGGTFQATCEQYAEEMVDKLLDEIQVMASQAVVQQAMAGDNVVLAIHPGIYVIPEPAGTLSPAFFELTFTRSPFAAAQPPPAQCTITATVGGTRDAYTWTSYSPTVKAMTDVPVSAATVMVPRTLNVGLDDLAPGESKTVIVALEHLAAWYLPGQNPNLPGVPYNVKPSTWIFFASNDAVLTPSISTCAGGMSQSFPQDKVETQPWEIPYP